MKHLSWWNIVSVLFASALISSSASAQTEVVESTIVSHAFYVQLLGNGIFYSLNYEQQVANHVSWRVGFGFVPTEGIALITLPVMISYGLNIGRGGKFVVGAGGTIVMGDIGVGDASTGMSMGGMFPTCSFNLRMQSETGGLMIEFGLTPYYVPGDRVYTHGGISIGSAW